jgi:capsular polysaccharide transport system permease protein
VFGCVVLALFFRELKTRVGEYRLGYLWAIGEPISHMIILSLIFGATSRIVLSGFQYPMFILTGIVLFDYLTSTAVSSAGAIAANDGLFVYKQVKPFDVVFSRAVLEYFIHIVAFAVLLGGMAWLGYDNITPRDPLTVLAVTLVAFFMGFGMALVTAVVGDLYKDVRRIIPYIIRPLYFLSCMIHPLALVPQEQRWFFLLNPLTHVLEIMRAAWFDSYPEGGASWSYVLGFTLIVLSGGMLLYRRSRFLLVAAYA